MTVKAKDDHEKKPKRETKTYLNLTDGQSFDDDGELKTYAAGETVQLTEEEAENHRSRGVRLGEAPKDRK